MKFHVTLGQTLAAITFIVGQVVAYGWLDTTKSQLVLSGATAIVTAAWQLADSLIQSSHVQARAAVIIAGKDPKTLTQ